MTQHDGRGLDGSLRAVRLLGPFPHNRTHCLWGPAPRNQGIDDQLVHRLQQVGNSSQSIFGLQGRQRFTTHAGDMGLIFTSGLTMGIGYLAPALSVVSLAGSIACSVENGPSKCKH